MWLAVAGKGGAGKSVVAGTLARIFARDGAQVLALDSDMMPGLALTLGAEEPLLPPLLEAAEQDENGRWRLKRGIGPVRAIARFSTDAPDGIRLLQCGKLTAAGRMPIMGALNAYYGIIHRLSRAKTLDPLTDAAIFRQNGTNLAFTTDSYVVKPLFFPGGDIGELAVNGTVNDLAMAGARPLFLSAGFIVEEGFPVADLRRVAASMGLAAREAGVVIAAGDTKVVERGKGDGVYVNTAGVGILEREVELSPESIRPGDRVLVSGSLGDHGMAIMIARGELELEVELESDTAPLHDVAAAILDAAPATRCLRDLTRGGLATALNELALSAGTSIVLDEAAVPLRPEVVGACEILGIDPLYVANEGKLTAVVPPGEADAALEALRSHPLGSAAALVGEVTDDPDALVLLDTAFGGRRVVDMLVGDPLPRIC